MSPSTFIAELASRQVKLWPDGQRLEIEAPKGELTPTDLEILRAHKPEIMAYLQGVQVEPPDLVSDHTDTSAVFDGNYHRPDPQTWSLDLRQRWADRANELFDEGIPWPHDERLAFEEIVNPHELDRPPAEADDAATMEHLPTLA